MSVDLSITISGSADYTLGEPATVTLVLVVRRDPALGPLDCNPSFQLGPDATNREQTIHVGETPVDLTTTAPTRIIRLVDGELPPGISIGAQGEFVGSATTTGDFRATLEACPLGIVFTCRQNTLLIHVLAVDQFSQLDGSPQLPVTGTPAPGMTIIGLALLTIGAIMARSARRRAFAPWAQVHPKSHFRSPL
jgi:LPXTG-motif cell wall-anchored protein